MMAWWPRSSLRVLIGLWKSVATGLVKYDHVKFIAGIFQRARAEQNGIDTAVWVSHHVPTKEEENQLIHEVMCL